MNNLQTRQVLLIPKKCGNQDYISTVPDDIIFQIFLHLPNVRCISECRLVCKRWLSLIDLHKRYLYTFHPSILFNFTLDTDRPFLELFPENSRIEECTLDYLPGWPDALITASCDDLLLVEHSQEDYFICNPLTREWIALPKAPYQEYDDFYRGYGLVSEPNKLLHNYRVVLLNKTIFHRNSCLFTFHIFCSKIGQWDTLLERSLFLPFVLDKPRLYEFPHVDLVVTHNGAVNWLDGNDSFYAGVVSFHPHTMASRFIEFPHAAKNWLFETNRDFKDLVQLGVVRGRLRLSLLHEFSLCVELEIWELCDDDSSSSSSWELVHKGFIDKFVFMLAFHPNDTDVVFLMWEQEILRLRLGENKYEKVWEIPTQIHDWPLATYMKVFPLLSYSLFPTPLVPLTNT